MSALDNLANSDGMKKLQAAGEKLQHNAAFGAVSGGMMATMGLILAGAIFTILSTLLNLAGVVQTTDAVYQWLQLPYNMTMGLISLAVAFAVAYAYTNNLGMQGAMANGFVALFLFLMVASPVQTVTLADGSTMSVLDSTYLGGTGMFTALILPVIVVRIIKLCADRRIVIRMPSVVPEFLSDSFSALIPLVINIVLWCGLNTLVESFSGMTIPAAIMAVLSIPLGALITAPGMFVLIAICMVFWSVGIQGTSIVGIVLMPVMFTAYQTNAELLAAGQDPVFNPTFIFMGISTCGGTGNVLPLAVACLRAKSQQLRAVGKAAVVPACFNISEPVVFGVPVMLNPVMVIPFILNTLITCAIAFLLFQVGFLRPPSVMLMTVLPIGFIEFLSSMAPQNLVLPVIGFVVGYLCYLPFVKIYDNQCLGREEAER